MPSRAQLERLLADEPDDAFLRYSLALELAKTDADAALAEFDRVLGTHPDYVPAYFMKAQTLAGDGRDVDAAATLTDGIAVADRVGNAHAAGEMRGFLETLS